MRAASHNAASHGISRLPCNQRPCMPWFFDCAGASGLLPIASPPVLPSTCHYGVGPPEFILFSQLNSTACLFPCQRFKGVLSDALT
jgi:hypothetical protein